MLGQTAAGAVDAGFAASGLHNFALATGVPVTAGSNYYVGLIVNGTSYFTTVLLDTASVSTALMNPFGLVYPLYAKVGTGLTSPPASEAFSGMTLQSGIYPYLVF